MLSSHTTKRRHGGFQPFNETLEYVEKNAWKCSLIQSPSVYSPVTPVIADLDRDGRLELIYAFQYDNNAFTMLDIHSVFDLHVQTINNMVQPGMIDFSNFLPMEMQS